MQLRKNSNLKAQCQVKHQLCCPPPSTNLSWLLYLQNFPSWAFLPFLLIPADLTISTQSVNVQRNIQNNLKMFIPCFKQIRNQNYDSWLKDFSAQTAALTSTIQTMSLHCQGVPKRMRYISKHFEENDIEKITKTFWDTQDMYHVLFVVQQEIETIYCPVLWYLIQDFFP